MPLATPTSPEAKHVAMTAERSFLTRLFHAASNNDFDALEAAIVEYTSRHVDVSAADVLLQFKDAHERTLAHFCAQGPILEPFVRSRWLFNHHAQTQTAVLRMKDKDGLTPLMLAAQIPDPALAERNVRLILLLEPLHREEDSHNSNNSGSSSSTSSSALLLTKEEKEQQHQRSLLALDQSHAGATALHYAAGAGGTRTCIVTLVEAARCVSDDSDSDSDSAAIVSIASKQGGTPIHWACAVPPPNNARETIVALLDYGADLNGPPPPPLSPTPLSQCSSLPPPPLHMCLAANQEPHAILLLQQARARSISLQSSLMYHLPHDDASNILHMAADLNMVRFLADLLQLLLDTNHDIDNDHVHDTNESRLLTTLMTHKNRHGLTPLDVAAREGHTGCVLLLLPPGPDRTEHQAVAYMENFQNKSQSHSGMIMCTASSSSTALPPKPKSSSASSSLDPVEQEAQALAASILQFQQQRLASVSALTLTPVSDSISTSDPDHPMVYVLELKQQGNACFAQQKTQQACDLYTQAISISISVNMKLDHDMDMITTMATLFSNRSACSLTLHNVDDALQDAVVAQGLQPHWPKAYFRVAMARLALQRYEDAAVAAWEGLSRDTTNDELQRLLQKCVQKGRQAHRETTNKKKKKHEKR